MLPLLLTVPMRSVVVSGPAVKVEPALRVIAPLVLPSRGIRLPVGTTSEPPPRLVSVPPWILAALTNCTVGLGPWTSLPPPALALVELLRARVPPLDASRVPPVLVNPPPAFTVRDRPLTLASIVPPRELTTVRPPLPIVPVPWIVLLLVRVTPPACCWMMAWPAPEPL